MIFKQYEERLIRLRKKESTLRNHRRTAALFAESGLDALTAEDWQIEEWLAGLQSTPHQRDTHGQVSAHSRALSPRTIRLHYENLSAVYRYAVHRRVLPVSPMETVALASEPDKEPKILDNSELRALMAAAVGEQQWLMLHLLVYTGIRRDELRNLRWDDIQATSIKIRSGKGDKLRHIPIHPRLAEVLFEQEPKSAYVIHGPHADRPLSDIGIYYRLQKLTPTVKCTFHDFRRTVTTSLAENGVQESVIDSIMGWAPRTVRQRYYVRRADATMQEAILKLYADDPLFDTGGAV